MSYSIWQMDQVCRIAFRKWTEYVVSECNNVVRRVKFYILHGRMFNSRNSLKFRVRR